MSALLLMHSNAGCAARSPHCCASTTRHSCDWCTAMRAAPRASAIWVSSRVIAASYAKLRVPRPTGILMRFSVARTSPATPALTISRLTPHTRLNTLIAAPRPKSSPPSARSLPEDKDSPLPPQCRDRRQNDDHGACHLWRDGLLNHSHL